MSRIELTPPLRALSAFMLVFALVWCAEAATAKYAMDFKVQGYEGAALADFPVLVRLSAAKGFNYSHCRAAGADIRFYDASGVTLAHEIDTWDPSGESLVWVKLPSLAKGTVFTMKYGNDDLAEAPDGAAVWTSGAGGYGGVWHFSEPVTAATAAETSAADSARRSETVDMTLVPKAGASGDITEMVSCPGPVGGGRVNGVRDPSNHEQGNYFKTVNSYSEFAYGGVFTLSMWIRTDAANTGDPGGLVNRKSGYANSGFAMNYAKTGIGFRANGASNSSFNNMPSLTDGWVHLAAVFNNTSLSIYTNGVLRGTWTGATPVVDVGLSLEIGTCTNGKTFRGSFDEIRLSGEARSADQLRADYDTVMKADFLKCSGEESLVNGFIVTGTPEKWGTVAPAYGSHNAYADGQVVECRATDEEFAIDTDLHARFAGWTLSEMDANGVYQVLDAAATNQLDYVHAFGATRRLVWNLVRYWRLTIEQDGQGEADWLINGEPAVLGDNWIAESDAVTVEAVAKNGSRFVIWQDNASMATNRAFALNGPKTLRAKVSAAGELGSDSYIQDGLVVQLDGLDNAALGLHDDTAKVWKNLAGEKDLSLPTQNFTWTWDADGWNVSAANGTGAGGPFLSDITLDWQNMTFEACAQASKGCYLFWADVPYNDKNMSVRARLDATKAYFRPPALSEISLAIQSKTSVAQVRDGMPRLWQAPGYTKDGSSRVASGEMTTPFYLFCANTYYNDRFQGKAYAIRLYDRVLTDHELRWNSFVDEARYIDPTVTESASARVYVEAELGVEPIEAGLNAVTKGEAHLFAITNALADSADDGARVAALGTGVRARYLGYTLAEDAAMPVDVADEELLDLSTRAHTATVTWRFAREAKLSVVAGGGGKISVGGADAAGSFAQWIAAASTTNTVSVAAVPDEGFKFLNWKGDLSGIADSSSPELEVTLPRNLEAVFVEADVETMDSTSYVQDGLVLHLDGLENSGRGTHGDVKVWKNLAGGPDLSLPTQNFTWTWDADGWNVSAANGTGAGGPFLSDITLDWQNMTFEACANPLTTRNNYLFWVDTPAGTAKFTTAKTSGAGSFAVPNASASAAFTANATHAALVENGSPRLWESPGVTAASTAVTTAGEATKPFYLFCANTYYNDRFAGKAYAIRLYDRALSYHELRWNAFVDRARFFDSTALTAEDTEVFVEALPLAYAIVPTEKGAVAVTKETPRTFSIADDLVTDESDSARRSVKDFGTGVRARYLGYTLAEDTQTVVRVDAAESVTLNTAAHTATVSWNFDKEYRLTVTAGAGGKVAVNGGAADTAFDTWVSAASAAGATVTAVPGDGYRFFAWKGDLKGVANPTNATIAVALDAPRSIAAVFVPTGAGHVPVTTAWLKGKASGAWDDPANWSTGEMPSVGDTVCLTNAAATTITLEQPVELEELTIGGKTTLKVSNWFSCIRAKKVNILSGGTITVAGSFNDTAMSNRVWIVGETLDIAAGGAINVKNGGYNMQNGPTWRLGGSGRPSYGGSGGRPTYGSVEYPTDPGSGSEDHSRAGGGAVLLDFSGAVTIDGMIDASGTQGPSGYNCAGSTGGGVLVKCASISGTGKVKADSSDYGARVASHGCPTFAAGGGRIAVHYDPAAQDAVSCQIAFTAAGGINYSPTSNREDPSVSGVGTLYFTDNRFLIGDDYKDCGWKFTGSWHSGEALPAEIVLEGDRTAADTRLEILDEGLSLKVNGNLSWTGRQYFASVETGLVLGRNAHLAVSGNLTLAGARLELDEGGCVDVAGSLTQTTNAYAALWDPSLSGWAWNGGALVLKAGVTNAPASFGAELNVGKTWRMDGNAACYVWSQPTNGAIVRLGARNFRLEKAAFVNADGRGYAAGYGPGIPALTSKLVGASHGGRGAAADAATSNLLCSVYGDLEKPLQPGSGGSSVSSVGYAGGGVVYLDIVRRVYLNGEISANANTNAYASSVSGGSGGSVLIRAQKILGEAPVITAIGGAASKAVGGGGRVAIWSCTNTIEDNAVISVRGGHPATTVSNKNKFAPDEYAERGTVFWGDLPRLGTTILVR